MGASCADTSLRWRRLHPGLPDRLPHPGGTAPASRDGPWPILSSLRHQALQTPLSRKNWISIEPLYQNLAKWCKKIVWLCTVMLKLVINNQT